MAAIPEEDSLTVQSIYKAYVANDKNEFRPHLGASKIGEPCERRLWYSFRWVDKEIFEGRMLRLFETGHMAEPRFIANLLAIGCEVSESTPDGLQHRVQDIGGHFGGSLDGVGKGIPEAPKTWHVLEFKTHSEKSFTKLKKEKVKSANPLHWAQMQTYMGYTELDRALYLAANKNTDELYSERIEFDQVAFAKLKAKAERIINASEPLPRISQDPTSFACRYCEFSQICHGSRLPLVHCRTCTHSTPIVDGRGEAGKDGLWRCEVHNGNVPTDFQRTGCKSHRYIPIFLERSARPVDFRDGVVIYDIGNGETFGNGDGDDGAFSSEEIRKAGSVSLLPELAKAKAAFSTARVVGDVADGVAAMEGEE